MSSSASPGWGRILGSIAFYTVVGLLVRWGFNLFRDETETFVELLVWAVLLAIFITAFDVLWERWRQRQS